MHAYKKKRRVGRKERRKQKAETGSRRKVHSKCKKITIYVRGSGQGEGAGFMDGCVDVRVCVTETKKSQYTI